MGIAVLRITCAYAARAMGSEGFNIQWIEGRVPVERVLELPGAQMGPVSAVAQAYSVAAT